MNLLKNKKLIVNNLAVSYDNKCIVNDINIYVNKGELVSIIGLSGTGKSTIFNSIAGIIKPESGEILLNGEDITNKRGKVSYMLQKDLLLPFKNILDNIALPLILKGIKKEDAYLKVRENLDIFGLNGLEYRYPKQLSGGQRQRAALLRTYLFSDDMTLLDEPFSALDLITKSKIHKWYLEIHKNLNLTTLLITHDIDEAILLSNRIYILEQKEAYSSIYKEYIINDNLKRDNTDDEFIHIKKDILNYLK